MNCQKKPKNQKNPSDQGLQVKICKKVNAVSCKEAYTNLIQDCSIPSILILRFLVQEECLPERNCTCDTEIVTEIQNINATITGTKKK